MNYIYIYSTVSVSLTTRKWGAYTLGWGGGLIFGWAYIWVEKCVTSLGGLYSGELIHEGAYLRSFTVSYITIFIVVFYEMLIKMRFVFNPLKTIYR